MKHSPKPFAVEIKKSRRAPALPLEPVPKERLDFGGPTQAPLEKDRSAASAMSGDDFAIPAFLQSDKPVPRPAADSWSKEAEQLFGPKPVAATSQEPVEARARPRILQSLIPAESPMTAPANDASAAAKAKTETPRPRRKAAQDERANQERGRPPRRSKIDSFADADAPRKAAGVEVQGELSLGVKREAKRRRPAASASLPALRESQPTPTRSFAKTPAQDVKDHADGPPRVSLARLGRDDAAALPRGQHWKRRLHPRAW